MCRGEMDEKVKADDAIPCWGVSKFSLETFVFLFIPPLVGVVSVYICIHIRYPLFFHLFLNMHSANVRLHIRDCVFL